ncbi:hypothetical protein ACOJVU_20315 [Mycobacterium sp. THU-M104]|uniref:hypothetical protein n=1 Tax=Mycobacterium sp. THU-M104 TaxID=3410515 RepID=UPI003B9D8342
MPRYRISAHGSSDELLGNLTITVTAAGQVSVRLPTPLGHLANGDRGRYLLSCPAMFAYGGQEWADRGGVQRGVGSSQP